MIDLFDGRPTYLFGCNEHSAALATAISIDGVIDDFRAGGVFAGHMIVHGDSIPRNAVVVNCVLISKPRHARKRVDTITCATAFDYSELLAQYPDLVPVPDFVDDTRADFESHGRDWEWLSGRLADAESRKVLSDVLRFRTSAELSALVDYEFDPEGQYFDSVVPFARNEVFVDCGGFDGDTTERFLRRVPGYRRVYLFEPSAQNITKARERLRSRSDIHYICKGVSDRTAKMSFDTSLGVASGRLIAAGSEAESASAITVDLARIDDEVPEPVTFIKMDIEGSESGALRGAQRHIVEDHPKLAVAVYHRASDFWTIPRLVLGIRDDYDLYLRHYSEGWTESVLYFIPKRVSSEHN